MGVPGELNRRLARGEVQVAPASSVEYARHHRVYRLLPDLSISAPAEVRTIQLLTRGPIEDLRATDRVAVPTASATSVVLVKIIMAHRLGIRPEYRWYDQEREDPFESGDAAALYIGDAAYREASGSTLRSHDLGTLWQEWTGHPFVFALWQAHVADRDREAVRGLGAAVRESRRWSRERLAWLAERFAVEYGWPPSELLGYWRTLEYGWTPDLEAGLFEFYRRAAELGEIPCVPKLEFLEL